MSEEDPPGPGEPTDERYGGYLKNGNPTTGSSGSSAPKDIISQPTNYVPQSPYEAAKVAIKNGYAYVADSFGRTINASGQVRLNEQNGRNKTEQLKAGGTDRLAGDDGGHLIARVFDGPLDACNHIAMNSSLNRGPYRSMEREIFKAASAGLTVNIEVKPAYLNNSMRPYKIDVSYSIGDVKFSRAFYNTVQGR